MLYLVSLEDWLRACRATHFVVFDAGAYCVCRISTARAIGAMPMPCGGAVAITPARASPPARPNETGDRAREPRVSTTRRLSVCRARFKSRSCREVTHAGSSSRRRVHGVHAPPIAQRTTFFATLVPPRGSSPPCKSHRRPRLIRIERSHLRQATARETENQKHWRVAHNCTLAPGGTSDGWAV